MKTTIKFLLLVVFAAIYGCERKADNEEVKTYIESLLSGEYVSYELPVFTATDIPDLLNYRDVTTIITKFPRNPISSYYQSECRLGVYVLWTIESIRKVESGNSDLIMRLPSQNSVLALRETHEFMPVTDEQSNRAASEAF